MVKAKPWGNICEDSREDSDVGEDENQQNHLA